jgi:hypothetical protein
MAMMEVEEAKVTLLSDQLQATEAQRCDVREASRREATRKARAEEQLHRCQEAVRRGQLSNVEHATALKVRLGARLSCHGSRCRDM